jgi:hypothetical protein
MALALLAPQTGQPCSACHILGSNMSATDE